MAFYRIKGQDREALPAGAVEVRTSQVAGFYNVVVETWERPSEVWALRYGPAILGAAGAFNGWYGNAYFRKKLRLKNFGFFSTYLPNMLLPFLIVQALHDSVIFCHSQFVLATYFSIFFLCYPILFLQFVQPDIFTNPLGCSLCKETRAASIQLAIGLIQPLLIVPASTFMFATRHFTHRIPSPIHNRPDFFKFCGKLYRPLKVPMTISAVAQVLLAFFITHMEENQFLFLQNAMVKPDRDENIQDGKSDA